MKDGSLEPQVRNTGHERYGEKQVAEKAQEPKTKISLFAHNFL
jgi:hypothetical protein